MADEATTAPPETGAGFAWSLGLSAALAAIEFGAFSYLQKKHPSFYYANVQPNECARSMAEQQNPRTNANNGGRRGSGAGSSLLSSRRGQPLFCSAGICAARAKYHPA